MAQLDVGKHKETPSIMNKDGALDGMCLADPGSTPECGLDPGWVDHRDKH
jgi:hypothetical protein